LEEAVIMSKRKTLGMQKSGAIAKAKNAWDKTRQNQE
jgi:hypothetical protein